MKIRGKIQALQTLRITHLLHDSSPLGMINQTYIATVNPQSRYDRPAVNKEEMETVARCITIPQYMDQLFIFFAD